TPIQLLVFSTILISSFLKKAQSDNYQEDSRNRRDVFLRILLYWST
ncbi:1404_t:CDS:2, partial [Gigaspora rosea]